MNTVNFYQKYNLNEVYGSVKRKSSEIIGKYLEYPDLYQFNDGDKTIIFKSERLIPSQYSGRSRVMLLFSNPHPYSVHQGMFLSPNTKGKENPFWETMRNAGWLNFSERPESASQKAQLCFNADYDGPFDFIFYTYYAFPTNYPKDIRKLFGNDYFNHVIEPEAKRGFRRINQETEVNAVVVFNKEIFNLVSEKPVDKYIETLVNGGLVESGLSGTEKQISIFLTFPTGWRYHREIPQLRTESLDSIKTAIVTQG